ncbi:MAG: DUF2155 domain-containing protein [Rhodobacteraceae bacterium]|nr:DUF2155 domain-containing protein [Paracoccaceae bacterium]
MLFFIVISLLLTASINAQEQTNTADGALLRGLDKVSGEVVDFGLKSGEEYLLWKLNIELSECRYPISNPVGDAFAHLTISQDKSEDILFRGWMIASSPALNPLEHARYDVWVLRCAMLSTSTE